MWSVPQTSGPLPCGVNTGVTEAEGGAEGGAEGAAPGGRTGEQLFPLAAQAGVFGEAGALQGAPALGRVQATPVVLATRSREAGAARAPQPAISIWGDLRTPISACPPTQGGLIALRLGC